MRKLILIFTILSLASLLRAQGPIDEMFEKYGDKDGFTVVTISGKMFSMFSSLDENKKDEGNIVNKLKGIKILTVEDSLLNKKINFYQELSKKLNFSDYEELMNVKEGLNVTKFLIRQKGSVISELLVITGGPEGNSLISIKGDLDLKTISEISKQSDIEGLRELNDLDKKEKKQ
jgi:hypothetical protein